VLLECHSRPILRVTPSSSPCPLFDIALCPGSWGRLLFDTKDHLDSAPHWALSPGTMIFLVMLSINYVGDGRRDALDARKGLEQTGQPP
jgi:hypothetical protein